MNLPSTAPVPDCDQPPRFRPAARLVAALPVARPPLISGEAAAFQAALAGWMLMR
jgi:hypothetical protein